MSIRHFHRQDYLAGEYEGCCQGHDECAANRTGSSGLTAECTRVRNLSDPCLNGHSLRIETTKAVRSMRDTRLEGGGKATMIATIHMSQSYELFMSSY